MQLLQKIFNRNISQLPLLTVLIHTDSFEEEILTNNHIIESIIDISLMKINNLNIIDFQWTPTNNDKIINTLKRNNIETIEYLEKDELIQIKTKKCRTGCFKSTINTFKDLLKTSTIRPTDYNFASCFDFFLVNDLELNSIKNIYSNCMFFTPIDFIELTRILLVNHNYYQVCHYFSIGEFEYLLYRFKTQFIEYQKKWELALLLENEINKKIISFLDSLSQRLKFICKAYDSTLFFSLKNQNESMLYHFGYFIILSTGIFDDLAWLINYNYNFSMEKKNKLQVTLVKKNNKSLFFENLKKLVPFNLSNYLDDNEIQNKLSMFYPIRDALQHREFLKSMFFSDLTLNTRECYFQMDKDDKINNLKKKYDWGFRENKDEIYVSPIIFSKEAFLFLVELVNNVLLMLNFDNLMKSESNEKQILINSILNKNLEIWELFDYPQKPVYF